MKLVLHTSLTEIKPQTTLHHKIGSGEKAQFEEKQIGWLMRTPYFSLFVSLDEAMDGLEFEPGKIKITVEQSK
jgi:hypothetical protein